MAKNIAWLNTAWRQYQGILSYLYEHASLAAVERFNKEIDKKLDRIAKYPESGHPAPITGVRFIIISKRYRLYYRHHGPMLYLVFLWDTRQNPGKNPYR